MDAGFFFARSYVWRRCSYWACYLHVHVYLVCAAMCNSIPVTHSYS